MKHEHGRQSTGVYTKTLVSTPVVRWILSARIRHADCNDVVLVGEDYMQVNQLVLRDGEEARLQHIATKTNFDARIRAATTFSLEHDDRAIDFLVKLQRDRSAVRIADYPPQLIVLTLNTSDDLVFIFMRTDNGAPQFVQQACPMPSFDRIVFQPGELLAVDSSSRALAVAADNTEIMIYSAKSKDQIKQEIKEHSHNWCPVSSQRRLQVRGRIVQMAFLSPPDDDGDHVILLLIVCDGRRTKAVQIDWYYSTGPQDAQVRPGQTLDDASNIPNLLIPLRDTCFLLITGDEITRWSGILTGSTTGSKLKNRKEDPRFPGSSSRPPVWVAWVKPLRNRDAQREKDYIYLVREDGVVRHIFVERQGSIETGHAGDFHCHVGTSFAFLGDEGDPDVLAVAGEMSPGKIIRIGTWPTTQFVEQQTRAEHMSFRDIEILPNWASVTDMIETEHLHISRNRSINSDNVLVTSGRQPFGSIAELRRGYEARLSLIIKLEEIRLVSDVWALPDLSLGAIVLILSMPFATMLLRCTAEFDADYELIDGIVAFDTGRQTITAGLTSNGMLVQVTSQGFYASCSLSANFEDTTRMSMGEGCGIVGAAIVAKSSVLATAELHKQEYSICCYSLSCADNDTKFEKLYAVELDIQPLYLTATMYNDTIVVLAAMADGTVITSLFGSIGGTAPTTSTKKLPSADSIPAVCDHLIILQGSKDDSQGPSLLAVCGLRDGRIVSFPVDLGIAGYTNDQHIINFGHSTVKLVQLGEDKGSACAMSGTTTCLVSWDGKSCHSLSIESIWVSITDEPEFAQGAIVAVTQVPDAIHLTSPRMENSLIMLSGDGILVASLGREIASIPRHIHVSGTPNRLFYARTLRSVVCSSLYTDVRTLPSSIPHSQPEERRQIWPVIEFISSKGKAPSFKHEMQPGERIHALLEWSYRLDGEKTYSFIMAGGSYVRRNGSRRGRVTLFQPSVRNWEVVDIAEARTYTFEQDVFALALYDPLTYVACAGNEVHMKRFSSDEKKWEQLCAPYKLASVGTRITVETDHSGQRIIMIVTLSDSLITLRLEQSLENGTETRFSLAPVSIGAQAENLIGHLMLDTSSAPYANNDIDQFTLLTTKSCQIIGMAARKVDSETRSHYSSGEIVFEAQLPRSLTRLIYSPSPERKGQPPEGVISDKIVGCSTDGATTGVVLIHQTLWRRLFWLQRLVEWSDDLSPHSHKWPAYSCSDTGGMGDSHALPIGLAGSQHDTIAMYTAYSRPNDLHVDGDILVRVLDNNGVQAVGKVLSRLSRREDAVGVWIREHIDEELVGLDELAALIRNLNGWM